jgi:hypothetical protein
VKPLKIEHSSSGGTEIDPFPRESDPSEDYLAGKGIALENLDTFLIQKNATNIQFIDPVSGTRTLQSLHTASQESFDNTSNGFVATNTQAAIEESATKLAKTRFSFVCTFNGTVTNNQWLGYSELMPGDIVPLRIPKNSILREISISFAGSNIDGIVVLYKNGTAAGNIIDSTTVTFANVTGGAVFENLNYSFASGDQLRGRWTDDGDNPSDMAIVYFFEVV